MTCIPDVKDRCQWSLWPLWPRGSGKMMALKRPGKMKASECARISPFQDISGYFRIFQDISGSLTFFFVPKFRQEKVSLPSWRSDFPWCWPCSWRSLDAHEVRVIFDHQNRLQAKHKMMPHVYYIYIYYIQTYINTLYVLKLCKNTLYLYTV